MSKKRVVVIGAGLGGISAAISLATKGFEVELFEKNDKIGGKLNFLQQDGYEFDLGPSIIILPHLFERLFTMAGKEMSDYVRMSRIEPQWRSFYEDGLTLDLHSDAAEMEKELAKLPDGGQGYWSFLEYSRKLYRFAEEAYLERGSDTIGEILRGHSIKEVFQGIDPFASMIHGIERHIKEPRLRDMMGFFIKYVGSSSYEAPALMNLLPYSQLGWGLWYVDGGMYNLARAYERLLGDLGVKIHLNTEITKILKRGDEVEGIQLASGESLKYDAVVSNMEVIPAYKRLLGEKGLMMKKYELLYEPAASGIVVHVGVDKEYPQLQHHNFFFAKNQKEHFDAIHKRKELPDDPTIYLVCPTVTNKDLAPPGHSIIKILPHIPYLQKEPFTPAQYKALEDRVFDKLERMGLEGLRKHIQTKHVLLPKDLEQMYYSNQGAIYGVVSDRKRNFSLKAPKRSERYNRLYFTGGSVNPGGGTCMVVLCGQQVAQKVAEDLL